LARPVYQSNFNAFRLSCGGTRN